MFYKCWMLLVRARWFWGVRVGALRRPRWLHDVDLIRELTGLFPIASRQRQKYSL